MESILYKRIKYLCSQKGVTITKLESDLGFGCSTIKKWERTCSPSIDKIVKIADYFKVSIDYLVGQTNIESPISDLENSISEMGNSISEMENSISKILGDKDIISFQRARQKMSQKDKDRMMKMLKLGFEYAFSDGEEDEDSQ